MQEFYGPAAGAVVALATGLSVFFKLKSNLDKIVDDRVRQALSEMLDGKDKTEISLGFKIEQTIKEISNLEKKIDKDILNVKEIYNSEIRSLGEKIESLRDQMQNQHKQMIELLSKMISDK